MSQPDKPQATILIVDDVDDIRIGLRHLLKKHGYKVIEAKDGREAEKVAKAEQPDLILMDLFMPKHDGFTSAREIHRAAELREVPIIAISAYGDLGIEQQLRQDAFVTGFAAYLGKPFDPDELLDLIQRHLPTKKLLTLQK
jgi:CheY-like chemotaxis protein